MTRFAGRCTEQDRPHWLKTAASAVMTMAALMAVVALSSGAGGCRRRSASTTAPSAGEQAVEEGVAPTEPMEEPSAEALSEGGEAAANTQTLLYPTGESGTSTLRVEHVTPTGLSAGKAFTYQIKLTNLTDRPMSSVRVHETVPAGFDVQQTDPAVQRPNPGPADAQAPASPAPAGPRSLDFTIPLGPQESRTIQVTGVMSQPGRFETSTSVEASGGSSLSSAADVAAPDLLVSKQGPERVDLCDAIVYKYVVTNNGAGDTGAFQVSETLPQGLSTEQGQGSVSFDLGSLAKGQSKEFVVNLKAAGPGSYSGSATAKGAFGQVASSRLTTVVVAPKLSMSIDAPAWEQVGRPVRISVTVRNDGDAPARETALKLDTTGVQGVQFLTGADLDTPLPPAGGQNAPGSTVQNLGQIEPGSHKTATFTARAGGKGQLNLTATATARCGTQPAGQQQAKPPAPFTATAQAQTTIVGVPATGLEVYDVEDPVKPGGDMTWQIIVRNYGSANDRDVNLSVTLPEGVQLADNGATGASAAKVQGQTITFAPLPTLSPGQAQQYQVKAKAPAQPGQKRLRVELKTAALLAPEIRSESTTVSPPPPPAPAATQGS